MNRKHTTSRSSLNQSIRIKRGKMLKSKVSVNLPISNEDVVNTNNTTRHYSAFSATKHRAKKDNFLISTSDLM